MVRVEGFNSSSGTLRLEEGVQLVEFLRLRWVSVEEFRLSCPKNRSQIICHNRLVMYVILCP